MRPGFYDRPTLEVAHDLIGCTLTHGATAGVIVETEAYHMDEPACHAYAGLTPRTAVLFGPPGRAYVYRSYGLHALVNAVCEPEGVGAAVLIRALEPTVGLDLMRARGGATRWETCAPGREAPRGPGHRRGPERHRPGRGPIVIGPRTPGWEERERVVSTRIGITKAVELPWRVSVAASRYVSRPWPRPAS